MSDGGGISVADTVRWLHDDGLKRLSGVAERLPSAVVAYTVDVASGAVTAHPATGVGLGSETLTLPAEELPFPLGSAGMQVVVGVTSAESVLVLDLASLPNLAVLGDQAEHVARSWVMQLLMNAEIRITTNSASTVIGNSPRCRQRFTPGVDTAIVTVDGGRSTPATLRLNPSTDDPDHLDVAGDYSGEVYLGARFWRIRQLLRIDDAQWSALQATFTEPSAAPPSAASGAVFTGDAP